MGRRKSLYVSPDFNLPLSHLRFARYYCEYDITLNAIDMYEKNVTRLFHVLLTPMAFATTAHFMSVEAYVDFMFHVQNNVDGQENVFSAENSQDAIAKMVKDGLLKDLNEQTWILLDDVSRSKKFEDIFIGLQHTTIAQSWSGFEVMATDLWRDLLNKYPDVFAQKAFNASNDAGSVGLTKRNVELGLLAKHNFDISKVLGDLLTPKFDFSGVVGIEKAYSALFGHSQEFSKILSKNQKLQLVEAARHLILHRGGIVDDTFLNRVSFMKIKPRKGDTLCYSGKKMFGYLEQVVLAASQLIMLTDDLLGKLDIDLD